MILKALLSAMSAAIAIVFCWFGFDGTRGGIAAASDLVAFSGFVFFCYGLASILLLLAAWATGGRSIQVLSALSAAIPLVFQLIAAYGKDGITSREMVYVLEVGVLLLVNALCLVFVAKRGSLPAGSVSPPARRPR